VGTALIVHRRRKRNFEKTDGLWWIRGQLELHKNVFLDGIRIKDFATIDCLFFPLVLVEATSILSRRILFHHFSLSPHHSY
jgi:hypothetical protein